MRTIELFAGAGGLATGFSNAGYEHAALVEFNRDACKTLRINFDPETVYEDDARLVPYDEMDDIDVVTGGPPCQPFSIAGKKRAYDDERDMFPCAIDVIKRKNPKAFVFENVRNLLSKSFSDYFEYIILRLEYAQVWTQSDNDWHEDLEALRELASSGLKKSYIVKYKCLNAADYGVPQLRYRVFIVGIRSDLNVEWQWPEPTHSKDKLLWDMHVSYDYWKRHGIEYTPDEESNAISARLRRCYGMFAPEGMPWQTCRDAFGHLPSPDASCPKPSDHRFQDGAKSYPGHTGSQLDWPSKTIKAGAHGVPGGENSITEDTGRFRYLTVHEAKLIQTFPSEFIVDGSWTEAMRQIGNAVPVKLAEAIAKRLRDIIESC